MGAATAALGPPAAATFEQSLDAGVVRIAEVKSDELGGSELEMFHSLLEDIVGVVKRNVGRYG